ncbi:MAG: MFS transporter [Chloroflexi bacterium]|nr:MFS transporter [Chloroflexota bacterium]
MSDARPVTFASTTRARLATLPWVVLAVATVTQMSLSLASQGLGPLVPFLQDDLRLSRAEVGLFISSIQAGIATSVMLGGWAVDSIGVRRMILAGQLLMVGSLVALSQAQTLTHVLLVLAVAGLGTGVANPATTLAIVHWFPPRGRGTAMGIKQTGVPLVGMIEAAALPAFALAVGWRSVCLVLAALCFASAIGCFASYREHPSALAAGAQGKGGWSNFKAIATDRNLLAVSLFAGSMIAVQFSVSIYLILYLKDTLAIGLILAGWVLAFSQLGGLIGRVGWGLVSDALYDGRRKPVLLWCGGLAAGLLVILGMMPASAPSIVLAITVFLVGLTAVGWHGIRAALVPELVSSHNKGLAVGYSHSLAELGPIFGPPLFGLAADLTGSYRLSWLILAVVVVLATTGLAILLREGKKL